MCNCGGFWTITISDIISIIALFIAAFAAWKAKEANVNAEKQFEENMKEQEKAINVSLFDMRSEILSNIENQSFSFDKTKASLLFDDQINFLIKQYVDTEKEMKRTSELMQGIKNTVQSKRVDDTYAEMTDLIRAISELESTSSEGAAHEVARSFINERPQQIKLLGGRETTEKYNYAELYDKIKILENKKADIYEKLHASMRQFIETSIKNAEN